MTRLNQLREDWGAIRDIALFGYGRQGKKSYVSLKEDFNIVAIIDNGKEKRGVNADGVPIMSLQDALSCLKGCKIVVTTQACNYVQIKKQLEMEGLVENVDFASNQQFSTEWYYRFKNQIRVMKTEIPVTAYCTLKCENCMMHVPYWKKKNSVPISSIKETLELYFRLVDYVMDIDVVGGEPFIYDELPAFLKTMGERYRDRIGYLGIITNGTVVPSNEVLDLMKTYNVSVAISDYSNSINYQDKVDRLCHILEDWGIYCMRNRNIEWFDFGFPTQRYWYEGELAYRHMQLCNSVCHVLDDKKLYYCSVDYGAQKGEIVPNDEKGYLDLTKIKDTMESRSQILELTLGNIGGGAKHLQALRWVWRGQYKESVDRKTAGILILALSVMYLLCVLRKGER